MLKKSIKYTDYNGNAREEDFYFDLSEAELTRLNFTTEGGLEAVLQQIIATQDLPKLYQYFEKIVQMSYGTKSFDGKYFEKSDEALRKFTQCPAYSNLVMELLGSSDAAAAFINGIIPQRTENGQQAVSSGVLPGQAPVVGVIPPR